ncbi:hypothetical protein AMATHDRAFT_76285 [Amanita thiersii Skay4041]|uniref:RNase III domain-containing protein n=1 Tax=Amanita thiersii Skay4041 TaxID=703135 RepID=A0A2A9NE09_9AGAR|nr:hypothetical protein AMATHDRAFT_76285 [Amanita thiersii Skay4041]
MAASANIPLPPLPKIHSLKILRRIFTHRGLPQSGRLTNSFETSPDDPCPNNERLEHIGDSVLGLVVTLLLYEMYPHLRVGPSSKIRSMMVGNITLAEISRKYKLPSFMQFHSAHATTLRASVNTQGELYNFLIWAYNEPPVYVADIFESFVGGLYLDQGLGAVKVWLIPLFRPYAIEAYALVREQYVIPSDSPPAPPASHTTSKPSPFTPPSTPSSLTPGPNGIVNYLYQFNQHLTKLNREAMWTYSEEQVGDGDQNKLMPVWCAMVMVDGKLYGTGKGNTKKAARNAAAKQGLEKLEKSGSNS